MKYVYLLFLFCTFCITGYAQTATSYSFSSYPGAFVSIADTTADSISGGGMASDDGYTPAIPIGFTFTFCGVNYTTCAGDANGVLSLAGNGAFAYADSLNIFGGGWLMPLWYDLYGAGRTAYYKTTGTPGSRVFTLEWHNWTIYDDGEEGGEAGDTVNFQVKLYEGTNTIQFVYGPFLNEVSNAVIGIANSTTDFQTLPYTTASTTDTVFNRSCSEPANGTVFQWCPPLTPPAPVMGTMIACAGSFTVLADTASGGAWSSSNPLVATVDSVGDVTGIAAGTAVVSYTIANACTSVASAAIVTINPLPAVDTITGGGNYCAGSAGVHIGLNASDPGISYQLFLNDTLAIGAPMAGTGASLDFGIDTAAGVYSIIATDTTTLCTANMAGSAVIAINPLPALHTLTGGGSYCAGTGGMHVGLNGSDSGISYQLLLNDTLAIGAPIAGTGASLDFGLDTAAGVYSVVATDTTTLCTANMAGSAVIAINPLPVLHTLTGGGSYCAGTGGVHVGLNGSDTGIRYQLFLNDTLAIGSPIAGANSSLDFGLDTAAGFYSIVATDTTTLCTANMIGSAVIAINPLPALHTLTGGGSYCSGTGGVHVGLNGSDTGIRYQLLLNDTLAIGGPMAGTGSSLDFGLDTAAGLYSIVATDTTTLCTANMIGSAVIAINPLPALHTLTGGGSYCSGTAGVHVGLNGSDTGIRYQLYYHHTALTGSPIAGTGLAIDFGLETGAGAYTAVATDTITGCSRNMTDSSVIVVNPLPAIHSVTGGGSYCAGTGGVNIGLNGSDTGIHYQLYYRDSITVGGSVAGTGSLFNFGLDTAAGIYTVIAANGTTGCTSNMAGSATVVITPVVIPSVSISPGVADTICAGEIITFTAAPMHGGGEPEYQWMVNDTAEGSHGNTYSYIPANGDMVSVKLTSDTACAIPDTATDTITVVVHPHELPTVMLAVAPGDTICEGTSVVITAAPGFGGDAPAYTWIKNTVIVSTDSTYSYTPAIGDNIYCIMQSNYFCRSATTAYSNVIDMIVENPVVPSVYITAYPGTYVDSAKPDSFTAVVTNGGADPSYQWYVNGAPYGLATSPAFKLPSLHNKDSISCIVTRNDACHLSTFSSVIVRVGDLDVQQTASSGHDITLMPNPNNGAFTITGSLGSSQVAGEDVTVEITDLLGQIVYRDKMTLQSDNINIEVKANALINGVYILTLHSESGNSAIRFVVAR